MDAAPLPPIELARYVGDDDLQSYAGSGRAMRDHIERLLGEDWSWEGKRVLDFGCASGRLLRHFLPEATGGAAEFVGVDIHRPSIAWLEEHLCPPLACALTGEEPPLPFETGSFDVVLSMSVLTHLTDSWAEWLLELHRVLKPGGVVVATVLGELYGPVLLGEPWDDDRIGMTVLGYGAPWDAGGPMVLYSEWWLRAHWGRAFDIEHFQHGGFAAPMQEGTQAVLVMRRRDAAPTPAELHALEPNEPREAAALRFALERTQHERADLNRSHDRYATAYAELLERYERLQSAYRRATPWRPLAQRMRRLATRARRRRGSAR